SRIQSFAAVLILLGTGIVLALPAASAGDVLCPPFNSGALTNLCVAGDATTKGLNTPYVSSFSGGAVCIVGDLCVPAPTVSWTTTNVPDATLCGSFVWVQGHGYVYTAGCGGIVTGTANGITSGV